jgi:putative SOS response-associated peptidase YedK
MKLVFLIRPSGNRLSETRSGKQPYAIGLKSGSLMALAGLCESWRSPAGERIRNFTNNHSVERIVRPTS